MTNPLTERRKSQWVGTGPALTREDLHRYADELNAGRLAKVMGIEWIVNSRREEGGEVQWYMVKIDRGGSQAQWKPRPGELAATAEVVARYATNHGITQEQFNSCVRRGVIDREVEALMLESAR